MKKFAEIILAFLGCAVLALIVGLVLAGMGQSGVVGMQITHALFWVAFVLSCIAAPLSAWSFLKSWRAATALLLITIVVVGGGLWWLNGWLRDKKAEQDALNQPPPPTHSSTPLPSVPIVKPTLPSPSASVHSPTKPQQDNSVHIGHGATVSPSSTGDCSPNIIGGSSTVNCAPPPPQLHWTQERLATGTHIKNTFPTVSMASNDKFPTENLANPGVVVKASIDRTATIKGYRVTCDRPCQVVNVLSDTIGGAFQGFLTNEVDGDDKVILAGATMPFPMPSNYQIELEIHSRDAKDVRVDQVTLIMRP